jgi:hypothetical protein
MYFGHILRRPNSFIPKLCLLTTPEDHWRRPAGGLRSTWRRTTFRDVDSPHIRRAYGSALWLSDWLNIMEHMAQDRNQWRVMIKDILSRKFPGYDREEH